MGGEWAQLRFRVTYPGCWPDAQPSKQYRAQYQRQSLRHSHSSLSTSFGYLLWPPGTRRVDLRREMARLTLVQFVGRGFRLSKEGSSGAGRVRPDVQTNARWLGRRQPAGLVPTGWLFPSAFAVASSRRRY